MRHSARSHHLLLAASLVPLLSLFACDNGSDSNGLGTGGSGNDQTPAQVVSVAAESATVPVASSVRLNIDFAFAREQVDDNDRNVILKIALPGGLRYEENSAAVDGRTQDDDVDPDSIEACAGNGTILTFNLDENDLTSVDDPTGTASARLKLKLLGISSGAATVGASAAYDVNAGSCAGFAPDAVGAITVTP